jgi:antitoxin YobK
VSVEDYRAARDLVEQHEDLADFVGERPDDLVTRAEQALGTGFPPSYRAFVSELGAGDIAGAEFYGVIDDDFESSGVPNGIWLTLQERTDSDLPPELIVVGDDGMGNYYALDSSRQDASGEYPLVIWVPGSSRPGDELETVAGDFGQFFREQVEQGLSRRGVT